MIYTFYFVLFSLSTLLLSKNYEIAHLNQPSESLQATLFFTAHTSTPQNKLSNFVEQSENIKQIIPSVKKHKIKKSSNYRDQLIVGTKVVKQKKMLNPVKIIKEKDVISIKKISAKKQKPLIPQSEKETLSTGKILLAHSNTNKIEPKQLLELQNEIIKKRKIFLKKNQLKKEDKKDKINHLIYNTRHKESWDTPQNNTTRSQKDGHKEALPEPCPLPEKIEPQAFITQILVLPNTQAAAEKENLCQSILVETGRDVLIEKTNNQKEPPSTNTLTNKEIASEQILGQAMSSTLLGIRTIDPADDTQNLSESVTTTTTVIPANPSTMFAAHLPDSTETNSFENLSALPDAVQHDMTIEAHFEPSTTNNIYTPADADTDKKTIVPQEDEKIHTPKAILEKSTYVTTPEQFTEQLNNNSIDNEFVILQTAVHTPFFELINNQDHTELETEPGKVSLLGEPSDIQPLDITHNMGRGDDGEEQNNKEQKNDDETSIITTLSKATIKNHNHEDQNLTIQINETDIRELVPFCDAIQTCTTVITKTDIETTVPNNAAIVAEENTETKQIQLNERSFIKELLKTVIEQQKNTAPIRFHHTLPIITCITLLPITTLQYMRSSTLLRTIKTLLKKALFFKGNKRWKPIHAMLY